MLREVVGGCFGDHCAHGTPELMRGEGSQCRELGGRADPGWKTGSGGNFGSEGCSALLFLLPDYSRPKPPRYSGYHRYQFRLYRQPPQKTIALSPEDKESLGKDGLCPRSRPRGAFPGLRIIPAAPGRLGMLAGCKGILTGDVGEVLNPRQAAEKPLGRVW